VGCVKHESCRRREISHEAKSGRVVEGRRCGCGRRERGEDGRGGGREEGGEGVMKRSEAFFFAFACWTKKRASHLIFAQPHVLLLLLPFFLLQGVAVALPGIIHWRLPVLINSSAII